MILPGVPDAAFWCWGVEESRAATQTPSLEGMEGSVLAGLAGRSILLGQAFGVFESRRLDGPWALRGLGDMGALFGAFWGLGAGEA